MLGTAGAAQLLSMGREGHWAETQGPQAATKLYRDIGEVFAKSHRQSSAEDKCAIRIQIGALVPIMFRGIALISRPHDHVHIKCAYAVEEMQACTSARQSCSLAIHHSCRDIQNDTQSRNCHKY